MKTPHAYLGDLYLLARNGVEAPDARHDVGFIVTNGTAYTWWRGPLRHNFPQPPIGRCDRNMLGNGNNPPGI